MENKTYAYIFNDILGKVLHLSENPSQFAEYLSQQIRELIGARIIVIAIKTDSGESRILSVFPIRRTEWMNQNSVLQLAKLSFNFETIQHLDREKSEINIAILLQNLEIDKAIAIPLIAADRIVGSILLLDIMDSFGIESVIDLLKSLSGVFALVIRNANLYQNMEQLVEARTAELQKSEMFAKDILQTAMDGFWTTDMNARFIEVNDVACKMLGYTRSEMLSLSIPDIELIEKPEQTIQRIQKIAEIGEDRFESKHLCKNGNIIDVEVSVKLQPGQNILVTFVHEITERKKAEEKWLESQAKLSEALLNSNRARQSLLSVLEDQRRAEQEIHKLNVELEQRVIERTAQLETANKELEAFSYSVSHDLRAPLRHISGFAEMLTKDSQDQLPEKSLHYLDVINDSAHRMGALIDDLLSFSRTGRAELKKNTFSMNTVLEDALLQLKNTIADRKIIWNIANLPEVFGDYSLVRLVWVNLLDNAVKYTKLREITEIRIDCTEEKEEFVFSIQDNGVGFDMQYASKLFGVFQRLHSATEFEGTGIGLANVRRITLRHGGRTWAEAEMNKGATFYFTLPKQKI